MNVTHGIFYSFLVEKQVRQWRQSSFDKISGNHKVFAKFLQLLQKIPKISLD